VRAPAFADWGKYVHFQKLPGFLERRLTGNAEHCRYLPGGNFLTFGVSSLP